jgi:hypothetical protein
MPYDFNNPWGMDKLECAFLKCFCIDNCIRTALEFGPGNSTQALLDAEVKVISMENDPRRAVEVRAQYPNAKILSYEGTAFPIIANDVHGRFDLAVVDGPPGATVRPGRLNSALFSFRRCKYMLFHDSKRDSETISVMRDLGMGLLESFDSMRGIVVLTK